MSTNKPGYQSDYRKQNPEYAQRQKQLEKLRTQARQILSERHATEYRTIYKELRRRAGLL